MPRCVKCGKQLEEDNKFCTQCGQPVTESVKMSYCENCGMQLEEDNKFCTHCGQPVTKGIETEQPVPKVIKMTHLIPNEVAIEQPKEKELQRRSEIEEA